MNNTLEKMYNDELCIIDAIADKDYTNTVMLRCIQQAEVKINNYMNWLEYDNTFIIAKVNLAMVYYNNFNTNVNAEGQQLASYTEGNKSESYATNKTELDTDGLTAEVKAMLPKPLLRVM